MLTELHSPVSHLGHAPSSHLAVDVGFFVGSHATSDLLHSTLRCLDPLPHVTEHLK